MLSQFQGIYLHRGSLKIYTPRTFGGEANWNRDRKNELVRWLNVDSTQTRSADHETNSFIYLYKYGHLYG